MERSPTPEGPWAVQRLAMIEHQLKRRGIHSPRVLAAMLRVPREQFVAPDIASQAYADRALSIDCDQTISQPYIVGLMTQALHLTGNEKVLEIGTGSGYQAAVLSELAGEVITIERHESLARAAAQTLRQLGYHHVQVLVGDGTQGCPARAPFDRIVVTAAAGYVPPALFEQLAEGGILVIPVGDEQSQMLEAIRKIRGQPVIEELVGCRFVPLVGAEFEPRDPQGER